MTAGSSSPLEQGGRTDYVESEEPARPIAGRGFTENPVPDGAKPRVDEQTKEQRETRDAETMHAIAPPCGRSEAK